MHNGKSTHWGLNNIIDSMQYFQRISFEVFGSRKKNDLNMFLKIERVKRDADIAISVK